MTKLYPRLEQDVEILLQRLGALRKTITARKDRSDEQEASTLDGEIVKLGESLETLKANCRANLSGAVKQYEELLKLFDKLQMKLQILTSPPLGKVSFIRFIRMAEFTNEETGKKTVVPLIEVRDANGRVAWVYFMDDKTDVHSLERGRHLLMHGLEPNHALETIGECDTEGVLGSVVEVLSADHIGPRFSVSIGEHGVLQVMHAALPIGNDVIEKGSQVLVDQAKRLILEVLPKKETSKEYFIPEVPTVTFDDIGGLDDVRAEIERLIIRPILYPGTAETFGRRPAKGFILRGPPGVGKTLIAKALINLLHSLQEARRAALGEKVSPDAKPLFYNVSVAEMQSKFINEGERRLHELFVEARRRSSTDTPVAIFLDEAEALLPIRGSLISSDVERTFVPTFTVEVDGLESGGNVIVILATNRDDLLDGAVKRPGRCDRIISVPRPNREGVASIFKKYLKAEWKKINPKYNVDIYTPLDRHKKPRTDASNKTVRYQFGCNPELARDYLIKQAVERIFDDSERSVVASVTYEDSGRKQFSVRFRDLVSGAAIENIVNRARILAEDRFFKSLEKKGKIEMADELVKLSVQELKKVGVALPGVELLDLYEAIEDEFSNVRIPNSQQGLRHWLAIEGVAEGVQAISCSAVGRNEPLEGD